MRAFSLMLLRVTLGGLMVWWGLDKLVNIDHAIGVSSRFYLGLFDAPTLLKAFGIVQIVMGAMVIVGLMRRQAYLLLLAITTVNVLAVGKSILDPWGWVFEGTNVLFYPSITIFAANLVIMAFQDEDTISLDAKRSRPTN